ncbi:MAG: hypothetical protein NPINA01_23530 [Nitrospinaceae bacterium]|nr:MAG: hypothetical protein NPINA01_23530 [Nitrospinaceae bacterium]
MTKEQFDQFKNKILGLSGDAEAFWEEIKALQTTKEKAIRLVREQKYLLNVRKGELQKAKDEIKNFKSHLREAVQKIKQLEEEKSKSIPSLQNEREALNSPVDLESIANDFDWKLAKKEEERTLRDFKKMELGF